MMMMMMHSQISQMALFRTSIFFFLSVSPHTNLSSVSAHGSYLRYPGLHPQPSCHPSWLKLSLVSPSLSMQMIWHYFNHFAAYPVSSLKITHSFNICNLCSWEHTHKQTKSKQILMEFIPVCYDISVLLNVLPIWAIKSNYVWWQHVE